MHNTSRIGEELLLHAGIIDELPLKAALAEPQRWGCRLGVTPIKMEMGEENPLIQALAQEFGIPATSQVGGRIAPGVITLVSSGDENQDRVTKLEVVVPDEASNPA